jgi:hypothetical protein
MGGAVDAPPVDAIACEANSALKELRPGISEMSVRLKQKVLKKRNQPICKQYVICN